MNLTNFCGLRRLRPTCRSLGTAAIEFALTLPIWIIILLGTSDVAYLLLVSQRVDRVAYSVTDIVTQSKVVTKTDLYNILLAAGELMKPFTFGDEGVVIVTSLYKPTGKATEISWQYIGGGTLPRTSQIGQVGSTPALPSGLTLNDSDNVIITEVYYAFEPMFVGAKIISARDLYRLAVYKPRLSPLITPPT